MRLSNVAPAVLLCLSSNGCADGGALSEMDGSFDGGEGSAPMSAPTTGSAEESGQEPGSTAPEDTTDDNSETGGETGGETGDVPEGCGDGVLAGDEACDDGNLSNEDGCTASCRPASCGDGFVQPGEQCDLGPDNANTGACTLACHLPKCGDGYVQPASDEQCDDADADNSDDCLNTCAASNCGDGFVQVDVEVCDDGNAVDGDGCSASCGGETRLVFVTSDQYTGDLGGLAGADAKCQALAERAGLPGTYMAWLSDDVDSPSTRFTQGTGYYMRVDGGVIAANWADLVDGQLWVPISVTELGGPAPIVAQDCGPGSNLPCVRTNTRADGTRYTDAHCGEWTNAADKHSSVGLADEHDGAWTRIAESIGNTVCMYLTSIYCFQQG